MRLRKSSNRKLYLCIGNQSGIGVWAIIMTAKTAPANAATPITAAIFLLRFFFTALQINIAKNTQTTAAASAIISVSHNHESSYNILIRSPYLSLANTGICLPFLSTILHYYTSLIMYRLHVSSFFTVFILYNMLEKRRLICRRLFVLYSLHFIDDDHIISTLNINLITHMISKCFEPLAQKLNSWNLLFAI